MALLEFFNTSLVINIGTILLLLVLVGGLYAYFSHKLSAQDHKISSMVSCVSTMAEEMQLFRNQMNSTFINDQQIKSHHLPSHVFGGSNRQDLIEVSDNDSDSDSDSDSDDIDSEDTETHDATSGEDDSQCEDTDHDEDETLHDVAQDIFDEQLETFNIHDQSTLDDLSLGENIVNCENIKTIHIDNNETYGDLQLEETVDLTKFPIPHLKEEVTIEQSADEHLVNKDELKTISIVDNDSDDEHNDSQDYKKMSLTKLREIAIKKKITNDASKMKKNDILKLLELD
jgi:hypothetical protein